MTRRKPITAAELLAWQKASGLYDELEARRARDDARRRIRELADRRASAPLLADLRSAGYEVSSVWDLVNIDEAYPDALPVLVQHLNGPYPPDVREGIARALAVRRAIFAWDTIRDAYLSEREKNVKGGLAVALGGMVDREHLPELIQLLSDTRNGPSRLHMLRGLQRLRDARAASTLEALASDADLHKQIAIILHRRRLRRRRAGGDGARDT